MTNEKALEVISQLLSTCTIKLGDAPIAFEAYETIKKAITNSEKVPSQE